MSLGQILILAIVQGIAEFLPISSSGHLVIVGALFGYRPEELRLTDVNIVLHLGTLGSILLYYWKETTSLIYRDRRMIPLLVIGTLPVAVIGLIIKKQFAGVLESALLAGGLLLVNGTMLFAASRRSVGDREYRSMGWREALGIGFAQAVALLPGISRSGSTISAGMHLGLDRTNAATFSFLLAIPAIAGAATLELIDIWNGQPTSTAPGILLLGTVVAFVVGLGALSLLNQWLKRGKLQQFAIWCWGVGLIVVVWQLLVRLN